MTFDPDSDLERAATFDVEVATSAKDAAGAGLARAFASSSASLPSVLRCRRRWGDGGADVAVDEDTVMTFSRSMDRSAAQSAFSLTRQSGNAVAGAFSWDADGTVLTLNPSSSLVEGASGPFAWGLDRARGLGAGGGCDV